MRASLLALVLGVASLGAAGCNEYHYYDVQVNFDVSAGQFAGSTELSTIKVMVMGVSGADTADIQIGPNANGLPNTSSMFGVFEFATFADSGKLTFNVRAYNDASSNPDCQVGQGMTTVDASSMTTNTATVLVGKTGNGCP
jgi:hypothetical protein